MRDLAAEPQRSDGPPVVWEGPQDTWAVLVLDPSGAAKHDELPATWRSLAEHVQVAWCRTPAAGTTGELDDLGDADEVLGTLAARDTVVDMVASGPIAEPAMRLAGRHAGHVRSLLLVDPGAVSDEVSADRAEGADLAWSRRMSERRRELDAEGIRVRVVAHSKPGERDRIDPPLPLGHPDVVSAVTQALAELDESADPLGR